MRNQLRRSRWVRLNVDNPALKLRRTGPPPTPDDVSRPGRRKHTLHLSGNSTSEGVAGVRITRLEAAPEPRHPLLRSAVGERLRVHSTRRAGLQPVITDGSCRPQALFQVAAFHHPASLHRVGPHPGVTVSLKLECDAQLIGPRGLAALEFLYLAHRTEQVLHVMPQLVRQNVSLGEIAFGSEAGVQD